MSWIIEKIKKRKNIIKSTEKKAIIRHCTDPPNRRYIASTIPINTNIEEKN